ncbi:CRISPR-associated helicase Cas3' [Lipingzhangella sp. LS1_29]|uniref:CRISPR-associated helicase Cas3 n=1 Tax=Lipingzhangella rawalii TaxID=2055835 RepID=A0ABU2H3A6_9ACTN|nr:CRISPR-associated helicase Cas3' [Lipingzhangella rawalii]MDS1269787.1 CRISPR-associated helicase Cas3' [Lipingzhangella rawalii]
MHASDPPAPPPLPDSGLWAKSAGLPDGVRYPLVCHLLDAAAAAEALWRDHLSPGLRETIAAGLDTTVEHAGRLVALWAGLHDIGKAMHCFQARDPTAPLRDYPTAGMDIRHDRAASEWLRFALPELGYPDAEEQLVTGMVAQLLGGHHGSFFPHADARSAQRLGYADDAWERERRRHLTTVHQLLGAPAPPERLPGTTATLVCGLVIQADWLVSQLSFVGRQLNAGIPHTHADLECHLGRSRASAPRLLHEAGLTRPATRSGTFADAFPHIEKPNGLQRSLSTHLPELCTGPGLLLVQAPTGEGKTEIALHAAEIMGGASGRDGLYVALPTMATADQMYRRVRSYLDQRLDERSSMTLLHGMAWLNPEYQPEHADESPIPTTGHDSSEISRLVEASEWLLGRKRGLLADFAVGTIDQALMAALRGRHNVVRMLGLAGKTVLIDEVHAADAYMLALLTRLLAWLGRLHVPVVLLSATLHHSTAHTLIEAYLKGAGRRRRGSTPIPAVGYPGWAYASAEEPHPVTVNPEPLATTERQPLAVSTHEIPLTGDDTTAHDQAVRAELAGLVTHGGCAAVIRTTVAEAQHTFRQLAGWTAEQAHAAGTEPPEMFLLHARFPAHQREEITEEVMRRFGLDGARAGQRPRAAILVATAIIEQSIDIDVDVMVSDLAPMHLLVQRAGRCWRHAHRGVIPRPSWASGPRLAVLAPEQPNAEEALPRGWRFIYHPSLLLRTHNLLRRWTGRPMRVPEDVQELVDGLIDDEDLNPDRPDQDLDRWASDLAHRQLGDNVAIPAPGSAQRDLLRLTDHDLSEEQVATRFGADTTRVVCCYADTTGRLWLDAELATALPTVGDLASGAFSSAQVRTVLRRSLPVPGVWLQGYEERTAPPEAWRGATHLRDVRLVVHQVRDDGSVHGPTLGGRCLHLDARVGLVVA